MEDTTPPQDNLGDTATSPSHADEHQSDSNHVIKNAVSEFVAARIELATIEAKEAAEFTIRKAISAVACAFCVFCVWMLLLAGLTGLLSGWAEKLMADQLPNTPGWAMVAFALALLHGIAAIVLVIILKKKPVTPLFELTRQEIQNDKAWAKNSK